MLSIAAVIATHNRPELLAERALASVSQQTRLPDHLVVVDDSGLEARPGNADIVAGLESPGTRVFYVENRRTPGASGAWNTSISYLQRIDPAVYVAILDDDDSWMPTYLEKCEGAVLERGLDMVAAGLVMHHSSDQAAELLDPPFALSGRDTLVRNTHIQGSNLFARLRSLLVLQRRV